jgi:hypothetical protein
MQQIGFVFSNCLTAAAAVPRQLDFYGRPYTIIFLICQGALCAFHDVSIRTEVVARIGYAGYDLSLREKIF